MEPTASVRFFDAHFERQLQAGELPLNPFEHATLRRSGLVQEEALHHR